MRQAIRTERGKWLLRTGDRGRWDMGDEKGPLANGYRVSCRQDENALRSR